MLLRDNTTPRGRHVVIPQRPIIDRIGSSWNPLPPGASWADSRQWLFGEHPEPREPKPRQLSRLQCIVCYKDFLTAHPSLAIVCGDTCRKRRWRELRRTKTFAKAA